MRSDAELLSAARSGDQNAFADLVCRYERAVTTTAWSVLGDFHAAQDVAQESFVIAYQQLSRIRNGSSFGPWLLTITRREAVRYAKRSPNTTPIDPATHEIATTDNRPSLHNDEHIVRAIGRLPEHERAMVVLHYLDGLSVKDIAELVGRPVGTVTKRLSRAIARLRRWLAKVPK